MPAPIYSLRGLLNLTPELVAAVETLQSDLDAGAFVSNRPAVALVVAELRKLHVIADAGPAAAVSPERPSIHTTADGSPLKEITLFSDADGLEPRPVAVVLAPSQITCGQGDDLKSRAINWGGRVFVREAHELNFNEVPSCAAITTLDELDELDARR